MSYRILPLRPLRMPTDSKTPRTPNKFMQVATGNPIFVSEGHFVFRAVPRYSTLLYSIIAGSLTHGKAKVVSKPSSSATSRVWCVCLNGHHTLGYLGHL